MELPSLALPAYPFKLEQDGDKLYIFDEIRKKKLLLTPEEWVRQHFVQFLINQKKYAKGLIKLEGGLKLNTLQKRSDILVHDRDGKPLLIVECKSTDIKLDQSVVDQAARYNMVYKAGMLAITNGQQHLYFRLTQENTFEAITDLPQLDQL